MITFLIAALVLLLVLGAAAGYLLLRSPRTDAPPRPEGLTPETRKRLEGIARQCDLGREIVAQVDGSALWPAYRGRITDRAQRRCLSQNLDGCLEKKVPLRKLYSAAEYREDTASLPMAREEALPFKPLSIHNTIKTLYIRFYLEDHNRELLLPPSYRPMVLDLEQQAAYLDQIRPRMSQAKGLLKQVEEASDENFLKVIYAAWSMRRPNREMREAALILYPDHPNDHFFMAVAMRQWFLILQRTLRRHLGLLIQDYDQRRRELVGRVRALEPLQKALNNLLPRDIAVLDCADAPEGFHPRYDCSGKRYLYKIWNSPVKNPFLEDLAYQYRYPIDGELANEVARQFVGRRDFTSLCAAGGKVEDKVRTIFRCGVRREGELVTLSVTGDGFLYNMVRILAGTVLEACAGKLHPQDIPGILKARDRHRAGPTLPPQGLYLDKVFYPGDEIL